MIWMYTSRKFIFIYNFLQLLTPTGQDGPKIPVSRPCLQVSLRTGHGGEYLLTFFLIGFQQIKVIDLRLEMHRTNRSFSFDAIL